MCVCVFFLGGGGTVHVCAHLHILLCKEKNACTGEWYEEGACL